MWTLVLSRWPPHPAIGAIVEWQAAGLLKPSVIKPLVTTLEGRLVVRQLGHLHAGDQSALRNVMPLS
jgi:mRNA interferase MazF